MRDAYTVRELMRHLPDGQAIIGKERQNRTDCDALDRKDGAKQRETQDENQTDIEEELIGNRDFDRASYPSSGSKKGTKGKH